MSKRVIIMNFDIESKAYQAFSEAKKIVAQNNMKAEQMAVIRHTNDGAHKFEIEDFLDFTGNNKASTGGFIGMLVGILGGPLGILLGWFAGGMIGASQDVKEIRNAQSVFEFLTDKIGEGDTGLILITNEEDNRPLNDLAMFRLGGEITRLDYDDVEADLKDAQELEKQPDEAAKNKWAEKHPQKTSDHQEEK
ncbi:DUF1269 domain-containing protein [Enterococcus sp. LJL90]